MNGHKEREQDSPHVLSQLLSIPSWGFIVPDPVYFDVHCKRDFSLCVTFYCIFTDVHHRETEGTENSRSVGGRGWENPTPSAG